MNIDLKLGDCLKTMHVMDDNSVDSVVSDPPYGINFMGKKWDYDVPKVEVWKEAMRVLKPGGHILIACGTRTQHRMAVNIEDAGFEIRDIVAWIYGSGFPKSLNIGKSVDKICGETGRKLKFVEWFRTTGLKQKETNEIIGKADVGSHYLRKDQPAIPTAELWAKLRPHIKIEIPKRIDELVERIEAEREIIGKTNTNLTVYQRIGQNNISGEINETKGTSEYEGWGTALKPAMELWTLARKPLSEKTIVENVLKWGTGGINIDECRVGTEGGTRKHDAPKHESKTAYGNELNGGKVREIDAGRFPANLIHDGSDEVVGLFPNDNSRFFYCAKASKAERNAGLEGFEEKKQDPSRKEGNVGGDNPRNRGVNKRANHHPTVKPVKLMQYLVRLITPKGGTVLDPYMGSGSTGIACKKENFNFVGIELDEDYFKIAEARIKAHRPDVLQHEFF